MTCDLTPCSRCNDFGILLARANGGGDMALCYCGCNWSKQETMIWFLPIRNPRIEAAFKLTIVPRECFLPTSGEGRKYAQLNALAKRWREQVRESEQFWKEHGPLFEEPVKFWNEAEGQP